MDLYDLANDPNYLHNPIAAPKHQPAPQAELEAWMKRIQYPMLKVFQKRKDANFYEACV